MSWFEVEFGRGLGRASIRAGHGWVGSWVGGVLASKGDQRADQRQQPQEARATRKPRVASYNPPSKLCILPTTQESAVVKAVYNVDLPLIILEPLSWSWN